MHPPAADAARCDIPLQRNIAARIGVLLRQAAPRVAVCLSDVSSIELAVRVIAGGASSANLPQPALMDLPMTLGSVDMTARQAAA